MNDVLSRHRIVADYIEAGTGPLVVLVHASMSGARQWSALVQSLAGRFRVRAVNLFGYGRTPAWTGPQAPTLDDYADLVISALPADAGAAALVGHSFGGAVAMQAALRLGAQADRLMLIEPSIFSLLSQGGRHEAFAEIAAVAGDMQRLAPPAAAKRFITYWTGPASWATASAERKGAYVHGVGLVRREFNAALTSPTTLDEWRKSLPRRTLVLSARHTTRPSREVVELLALAGAGWEFAQVPEGAHMSPLTHPHLVNPVVADFLGRS